MEDFPDVLRATASAEGLTADQRALIEAPELATFWQRIASHVLVLVARGWSSLDAAAMLVGAVLTPLALGHDARGLPPRRDRATEPRCRARRAAGGGTLAYS